MSRVIAVILTFVASAFFTFGILIAIERGTKARQSELFESIQRQEERLDRRFTRFARKHDDQLSWMQSGLKQRTLDIQQIQAITVELSKYESDIKDVATLRDTVYVLRQELDFVRERCRCCPPVRVTKIPNGKPRSSN